jgi:hypothetical protein
MLAKTRVGGVDLGNARTRTTLAALTALAAAPDGLTVADLAKEIHAMTSSPGYTARQAAHDLRKPRAHALLAKPGPTGRYHVPARAQRAVTAPLVLRQHVVAPIVAGVRSPLAASLPTGAAPDRDDELLRARM